MPRWQTLPAIPVERAVTPTTIAAAVPRFYGWLKYVRHATENTCDAYRRTMQEFSRFAADVGLEQMTAMTPQAIEMYLAYGREMRQNKPSTSHRKLYAIRTFFNWCIREGYVATNPSLTAMVPPVGQRLPRYLTVPEQERLLEVLRRETTPVGQRLYMMVLLALLTGLRVSELVAVRVDELDLERGVLTVTQGKGNKQREVPLIRRVVTALRSYLEVERPAFLKPAQDGAVQEVPWLFPLRAGRGRHDVAEPMTTRTAHNYIAALGPVVGKPLHPHMLRHSYASRLRESGAPLELISEVLGHSSVEVTMIYAHLSTGKQVRDITRYLEEG